MELPSQIEELTKVLSTIPGLGKKTASRHSLNLAQWDREKVNTLIEALEGLKAVRNCNECGALTENQICGICESSERVGNGVLCVVESYSDFLAIESSNSFKGIYHILGGVLNPLLGIGPNEIRLNELKDRVKKHGVKDIILAINPSVEGDATCSYIKQIIPETLNLQRIGFGIPIGGSLDLLDASTIHQAIINRRTFD
ncbi:MAG: recombination mediator RecR [Bacteriovoracaceae bacterium]